MEYSTNYLEKLELFQLMELSDFIISENYIQHNDGILPLNYQKEVTNIFNEEKLFFQSSAIYVIRNILGNIIASIRILKWNYKDILPIQKVFNISPYDVLKSNQHKSPIWHIGRFAINRDVKDRILFKKLMVCVSALICENKAGCAFAECDSKLLRVMNLMGIKTNLIGSSVNYLGSETIPVSWSYENIKEFYINNKSLISEEILT